jgi:hypothetical protein
MKIESPAMRGMVLAFILLVIMPPVVDLFSPLDNLDDPVTGERFSPPERTIVGISIWITALGAGFFYYLRSKRLARKTVGVESKGSGRGC